MMRLLAYSGSAGSHSAVIDLVILLTAAALVAMVLRRASLATIPSFLITGALIGPNALGLIQSNDNIASIGQVAVVMLMFTIGLHMDTAEFSGGMVKVFAVGIASTGAVIVALLPLTAGSGGGLPTGLAIAIALAMSSTAVVMRLVAERRETHKTHGRIIFGTLVVQDLIAIGGLALMPVLATWAGVHRPGDEPVDAEAGTLLPAGWPAYGKAAVAIAGIAVMILLSRLILPRLLKEATRGGGVEVLLVLSAAVALGSAAVASGLGFSAELGAFLAGFILATTPFRYQLSGQITPMRDLFMAVFFTAVGLKLDLHTVAESWQLVTVGLVATLVLKAVAITGVVWVLGATAPVAVICGLAMCQAGEFTIVLLSEASSQGLLKPGVLTGLTSVVVLSLILTPSLYGLGHRLRHYASRIPVSGWSKAMGLRNLPPMPGADGEPRHGHDGHHDHAAPSSVSPGAPMLARYVIVAGFGVVGRALADRLEVAGVPFCIVDLNQNTIATQRRLGRQAVYGDITNTEVLTSAGIDRADAVLITIPDDEATLRACRVVRETNPTAFIAVRTGFLSKAMVAAQEGADHVTIEEVATAEAMARQVMDRLAARAGPAALQSQA